MPTDLETVRAHLRHHFTDDVARAAGLTLGDLARVIAGSLALEPWQIEELAKRMRIKDDPQ